MEIIKFQDHLGEWRWHAVADNGRIMADSSEGYTREEDVDRAIKELQETFSEAKVSRREA